MPLTPPITTESRVMVRPRFASTVVLVRPDENGGFEVLLTRRPEEMRFLGGFYVFPGGTVHAADYSQKMLERCRGISGAQAQKILAGHHEPGEALGHWVAVVRELFEEVGVLLCVNEKGEAIQFNDAAENRRIELARRAIVAGETDFGDFLRSENLFCELNKMMYFDHWVTPGDLFHALRHPFLYRRLAGEPGSARSIRGGDAQLVDQSGSSARAHGPSRFSHPAADHDGLAAPFSYFDLGSSADRFQAALDGVLSMYYSP